MIGGQTSAHIRAAEAGTPSHPARCARPDTPVIIVVVSEAEPSSSARGTCATPAPPGPAERRLLLRLPLPPEAAPKPSRPEAGLLTEHASKRTTVRVGSRAAFVTPPGAGPRSEESVREPAGRGAGPEAWSPARTIAFRRGVGLRGVGRRGTSRSVVTATATSPAAAAPAAAPRPRPGSTRPAGRRLSR